jgi:hypothetical protein
MCLGQILSLYDTELFRVQHNLNQFPIVFTSNEIFKSSLENFCVLVPQITSEIHCFESIKKVLSVTFFSTIEGNIISDCFLYYKR